MPDILGSRLEEQNYAQDALLCHVCAGNVDQLIRCLNKIEQDSPDTLQVSCKLCVKQASSQDSQYVTNCCFLYFLSNFSSLSQLFIDF